MSRVAEFYMTDTEFLDAQAELRRASGAAVVEWPA